MRKNQALSNNEYQIMELLWDADKPLSKQEIIDQMPDKNWKASSIYILISSLLKKNMIEIAGFVQSQTNYSRTFSATSTKKDYLISEFNENRKKANLSVTDLVSGFIDDEVNPLVIKELEEMIQNKLDSLI